jgi:hypothetical protein
MQILWKSIKRKAKVLPSLTSSPTLLEAFYSLYITQTFYSTFSHLCISPHRIVQGMISTTYAEVMKYKKAVFLLGAL